MSARVAARRSRAGAGGGALLSAAGLIVLASLDPQGAARGWLAGWFLALSVSVGSAALVMIHVLAGGRWRAAGEPWLSAAAGCAPLLALGGAALLTAQRLLYPWADGSVEGSVGALWLSAASWNIRLVALLGAWAALGWSAPRMTGRFAASIGLIVYALTVSIAGLDWLLSLDRHFTSTDFGAQMAVTQLAAAFALPAVLGLGDPDDARADWGGMLLAALLGAAYLAGMQFLVSWSGDLPDKAAWYLARNQDAGLALAWAILLVGGILPLAILIPTAWRRDVRALRIAGILVIFGAAAHLVWIVAPLSDPAALAALPAAGLVIWLLWSIVRLFGPMREAWR